jgi:hypothetical protein
MNQDSDIVILTETNLLPSQKIFPSILSHNSDHQCICSSSEQRGTGILILLNSNCKLVGCPLIDPNGRYIAISICFQEKLKLNILAVYAPAKASLRESWYNELFTLDLPFESVDIFAGDFNLITNPSDTDSPHFTPSSSTIDSFNNFLNQHSLIDVIPNNYRFTFTNNNTGTHFRLDRFYIRSDLASLINSCTTHMTPKSNHRMVILSLDLPQFQPTHTHKIWRLQPSTANDPSVINTINNTIQSFEFSSNISESWIRLKEKCVSIYREAQTQQTNRNNNLKNRIRALLNRINNFSMNDLSSEHSLDKLHAISNKDPYFQSLINEYENILDQQRQLLKIKAGIHWDCGSEFPSKFLTRQIKGRSAQKTIFRIKHPTTGELISDRINIQSAFFNFFSNLFKKQSTSSSTHLSLLNKWSITNRASLFINLDSPITGKEVEKAIDEINPNKSPGLDGLTGYFYKNHKVQLTPILVNLFNRFLSGNEKIPLQMKEGLLVTISKPKGDPLEIDNRRPIALLNLDYKLYSKILNNRLKLILPNLISPFQSGFVKGRLIFDNVILLDSIFNYNNQLSSSNGIVSFVDFKKAFDSVSHEAIQRTLDHLQLPSNFQQTVLDMLSDTKIRILVNGELTEPILIERGTKQGDPISPTLFVLVIEALSQALQSSSEISGLPFSPHSNVKVKCLLFADDLVLLSKDYDDLQAALTILRDFHAATALQLNVIKSSHILFNNVPYPSSNLPFKVIGDNDSERYLGFSFDKMGLKSQLKQKYHDLVNLLVKWKQNNFTTLSKVSILKSYGLSKLNYLYFCDPLQNRHYYNNINKLVNWFLWSKSPSFHPSSRYLPKMKIDRLFCNFDNGGVNLWNNYIRHMSHKAFLIERVLHDQHNLIIYSAVWKHELNCNQSHHKSRLWTEARDAWTFFKRFTHQDQEYLLNEQPLNIKRIYNLWQVVHNNLSHFTNSQIVWMRNFNLNYTQIFRKIHSIKSAPRLRNFMWKLYNKALPIMKDRNNSSCSYCGDEETTLHLFFECSRTKQVIQTLHSLWTKWYLNFPEWSPQHILPLNFSHNSKLFLILTSIALWTIWNVRNTHTIANRLFDSREIINFYTREVARYISARWHVYLLRHVGQTRLENPLFSFSCPQKQFLRKEALTSLIPYHFSIINNVAVCVSE